MINTFKPNYLKTNWFALFIKMTQNTSFNFRIFVLSNVQWLSELNEFFLIIDIKTIFNINNIESQNIKKKIKLVSLL